MSLNRVVLQGRLAADVELKTFGDDQKVGSLRIAVDRDRKNKEGEREADFFNVTAWRKTAEFAAQYFAKGDPIVIDGRLMQQTWKDDNGNNRSSVEVVAENIYFAGGKSGDNKSDGDLPF